MYHNVLDPVTMPLGLVVVSVCIVVFILTLVWVLFMVITDLDKDLMHKRQEIADLTLVANQLLDELELKGDESCATSGSS